MTIQNTNNNQVSYTPEAFRLAVTQLETMMLEYGARKRTQEDPIFPLTHRFVAGMYCREIFMPKGSFLTSYIHKYQHFAFILTGKAIVMSENGPETIEAPRILITEPGTKRVLHILEDMRWATVHLTEKTSENDVPEIEDELTSASYEDFYKFQIEHTAYQQIGGTL